MDNSINYVDYTSTSYLLNATFGISPPTLSSSNTLATNPFGYQNISGTDPYFSNQFTQNQSQAINSLLSYAQQLQNSSSPLQMNSTDNLWQQMSVASSNTGISGTALNGATNATYTINVTQVATAQQNISSTFTSSALSQLASGSYSFNLSKGSNNTNITFNVNSGDNQNTVLTNMAQAINSANAGVTATVATDTTSGTSRLVLNANATGTNNSFSLTDVTGNAVAYTGINSISTTAANAAYSINGVSFTSNSNTVSEQAGLVQLNLTAPANNATVTVGTSQQAISAGITNFVNSYNSMTTFLNQNQSYIDPQLANNLQNYFANVSYELQNIGISANSDGTLSINQTMLNSALQNNMSGVQNAFSGLNGLAITSGNLATDITSSPMNSFATYPPLNQNTGVTYNNSGALNYSGLPWWAGNLVNMQI